MDKLEMACLGRPFRLGMLYDCRNDMLVPGMTLWNDETLKKGIQSKSQVGSDFEVIAEDNLESKASKLNVNASLKLSFLGGLVEVSGSAKYLNNRKSSNHQSRVSLKYWSTSRFDQLTMIHLGKIEYHDVIRKNIATHVVVAVLYGADAFFVFDRRVEDVKSVREVHGKMEGLIKALPGISEIKGDAEIDMQDEDKKEADKLECKFHGDVRLKKNPTTFTDAVNVFQQLPELIQGDDDVPKKVWLRPLSDLDSDSARIVHEISTSLVNQAQEVMEDLLNLEIQCNDLMNTSVCSCFSNIQKQLSSFKGIVSEYKMDFSKKLTNILPTIREGGLEESQLADIFKSKEASPFCSHNLSSWIKLMEKGVKVLGSYFQEIKSIEFTVSAGDLEAILNDFKYDYVICLSFKIAPNDDEHLKQMRAYLNSQDACQPLSHVTPWFKNKELMGNMRRQVRQFTMFAEANKENDRTKFIVTECDDEDYKCGSAIQLFENGMPEEFDPPGNPDKINSSFESITNSSVHLEWSKPEYGSKSVEHFTILYGLESDPSEVWKKKTTKGNETFVTVDNLQAESLYCFKVRAECQVGVSQYIKASDPIKTLPPSIDRLAVVLKDISKPILHETGLPPVYKLDHTDVEVPGKMLHKVVIGEELEKVLMVLGATGAGKTTLINGMVNYIMGVEWKDNFRFKLVTEEVKSQAHSQPSVTAYTIHRMEGSRVPYTLTIIDTPGFGDTTGLKRDKLITEQIKEFFSLKGRNGISHLDGIGFVTQSALARPTHTQQYIFDSILAIFGKDVSKNIFMMVTFADGQKPPVITAVEEAKIPHSAFFKFNNSALFADIGGGDDNFDEMFWRMGINSFKKFFATFQNTQSVSILMTKDVLEKRDKIQAIIEGLQRQMQACMVEMESLRQKKRLMEKYEAEITANKEFTYKVKVPYCKTIKLDGTYATNCLFCNVTCQNPCLISDKRKGANFSGDCCTVCHGKCHWKKHEKTGERLEPKHRIETMTLEDLKKKYLDALSEKSALDNMIDSHQCHLEKAHDKLQEMVDEARVCLTTLREIALKPYPLTQVEYIQQLIDSEKKQAKEGWMDRVNYLEVTKKQAKLLSVMQDMNDIDQRIEKEKMKQEKGWEETIETLEQVKRIKSTVEDIKHKRAKNNKGTASFVSTIAYL